MSVATIITPGSVTERGVTIPDWASATETSEDGWRFTPLPASEVLEYGRQGVTVKLAGCGPYDSVVTAHCRVTVGGETYEVAGEPQRWPSLTGDLAHTEVVLQRVDG